MDDNICKALNEFVSSANILLQGSIISAYCYGSAVYGDFHSGYSDLDFFIISESPVTEDDFNAFSLFRDKFKASENPYFSVLEGEIVSKNAIKNDVESNVIYWGTKTDKLNKKYSLSGFSLKGLVDNGYLITGCDIRDELPYPNNKTMLAQVDAMIDTIRKYAQVVNADVHSLDWLFLISQSIYWLKTLNITGKTEAANWLLENCSYTWANTLQRAILLRREPMLALLNENKTWIENLGETIQNACTTLQNEYTMIVNPTFS